MNKLKQRNSATYVKPIMQLLEMEVEGSLLLTASDGGVRFGAGVGGAGNGLPNAGSSGRWSTTLPGAGAGGGSLKGAGSAGRTQLN